MPQLAEFGTLDRCQASPESRCGRLHLDAPTFLRLFRELGPSLGLWRAAEIAALREQAYARPVLDLGCGDGFLTSMLLASVEFGLDPDQQCLSRAATRHLYERLIAQPAERAPVRAGLRTILSNSVLEHIERIDGVLASVAGMLRPGGRFIFTVPTEAFSAALALPFERYRAWRNRQLLHLNLWSLDAWIERLSRAGFSVREVRCYLRPGLVRAWDAIDLLQQIWIGRHRVVGALWKALPESLLRRLARRASRLDLASEPPGGGRLIVAVRN